MSKKSAQEEWSPARTDDATLRHSKKRKRADPKHEARDGAHKGFAGKVKKFDDDEEASSAASPIINQSADTGVDASVTTHSSRTKKPRLRQKLRSTPRPTHTISRTGNSDHRNGQPEGIRPPRPTEDGVVPPHLVKKCNALLPVRKTLPIWTQADAIRAALKKNNVLVLTGETGSGKSTQVPQFLASESWCTKCIAITQPRRVAAISLARRVAEEMGSFMGSQSPAAKVGYSVRFDNATVPGTKIKFLTEGMLLQEMLRDPTMSQYSAIVVDEVHERSVNVDLILGFLKNLLAELEGASSKRKHPLKVVIMSATADVESLVKFFEDSQAPSSPGPKTEIKRKISTCYVEGRQYPVKTVYLPQPTLDWIESALKIIFQVHYKEPLPGDILVFLTGQDAIEGLEKLVNDYAEGMDEDVPKVGHKANKIIGPKINDFC